MTKVLLVASVARHFLAFHLPFIRLLQDMGCEVQAACDPAGEGEALAAAGVRVWSVPVRRSPWRPANLFALIALTRLMRRERYRMVHVHTPMASFLGRVAARLAGVPAVLYTAHGFHFYRGAPLVNWLLYYPAEWLCARWTDGLLVMNQEDHERALRLPVRGRVYPVPGVGVDIPGSPVAAGVREHVRAELGLPPGSPLAIVAGELSPTKNGSQVLRAWQVVLRELPGAVLLVVGDGSQRRHLERLAQQLGIAASARFLGFRRDLGRLLPAADVLVSASRREGLPRVVMEAMAASLPVVASDVRGHRDLVEDGRTGFLVAVRDTQALAEAVMRLFGDKEAARIMGLLGMAQITAYDLKRVTTLMAQVYSELGNLPRKDTAGMAPNQSDAASG